MFKIFDHGINELRDATEQELELLKDVINGPSQEDLSIWYTRDRDALLLQCDWTQLPDVILTMTNEKTQEWKQYRQSLRDITAQANFPNEVIWPVKPV
jgi:hypothetical protein